MKQKNVKQKKEKIKKKPTKDPTSMKTSNDKVSFYIPYNYFFDDERSILMLKNGGLMKVFEIKNQDLTFVDNINDVLEGFNSAIKLIDSGLMFHYETQKIPAKPYKEEVSEFASIPTILTYEKRKELFQNVKFYETRHFLTVSYFPDFVNEKDVDVMVATSDISKEDYIKKKQELFREFNTKVNKFISIIRRVVFEAVPLSGDELGAFLYRTINPVTKNRKVKMPPAGVPIFQQQNNETKGEQEKGLMPADEYLSASQILYRNGTLLFNGDTYAKTISIRIFADMVIPQFFSKLEEFDFPFRMVHRFIGLSKKEAQNTIKKIQHYQKNKRYNFWQIIQNTLFSKRNMGVDFNAGEEDKERLYKSSEAEYAGQELKAGAVSYGYYTFTFIVFGNSYKEVARRTEEVVNYIDEIGFTCVDDKLNTTNAYFGAMPANIKQNLRKSPIDSKGLSDLIPISSIWEGNNWDLQFNAPNLLTTLTDGKIFFFNNKVRGVGHTAILGKTGRGKSVFLLYSIINFLKYSWQYVDKRGNKHNTGSQVFMFDKGATSKAITHLVGGQFYDLDSENHIGFQPLRNIEKDDVMEFAIEWTLELVRLQAPALAEDIETKQILSDALLRLSTLSKDDRTITNLKRFCYTSTKIQAALNFYTNDGPYGAYFDNVVEGFGEAPMITFEVGTTVENENIFLPITLYLFFEIESRMKNGIPTFIGIDEVHNFLKRKLMSEKIQIWLKELRKKNGQLWMATQEIHDINVASISSTIKTQVPTKIFLPDVNAMDNAETIMMYRNFGVTDEGIGILKETDKNKLRRYLCVSSEGTRMFDLNLTPVELAFLETDDAKTQNTIENLVNTLKERYPNDRVKYLKELNKAFLQFKWQEQKIDQYDFENARNIIDASNYNIKQVSLTQEN